MGRGEGGHPWFRRATRRLEQWKSAPIQSVLPLLQTRTENDCGAGRGRNTQGNDGPRGHYVTTIDFDKGKALVTAQEAMAGSG